MGYRSTTLSVQEFFHVYNRGNSKQTIFHDQVDFARMQQLLFLCNGTQSVSFKDALKRRDGLFSTPRTQPLVAIGAYCLLPNHFHLLLTPLEEQGVSIFMQKVATAYAMYFNKRYQRTGSLFEGPFKAQHAATDKYLKYLFAYIHLNPVPRPRLGTTGVDDATRLRFTNTLYKKALSYPYSSLIDYVDGSRDEAMLLQADMFPLYHQTESDWRTELECWIDLANTN